MPTIVVAAFPVNPPPTWMGVLLVVCRTQNPPKLGQSSTIYRHIYSTMILRMGDPICLRNSWPSFRTSTALGELRIFLQGLQLLPVKNAPRCDPHDAKCHTCSGAHLPAGRTLGPSSRGMRPGISSITSAVSGLSASNLEPPKAHHRETTAVAQQYPSGSFRGCFFSVYWLLLTHGDVVCTLARHRPAQQ